MMWKGWGRPRSCSAGTLCRVSDVQMGWFFRRNLCCRMSVNSCDLRGEMSLKGQRVLGLLKNNNNYVMMIWELNLTARCRFWTQSQLIRFQSAVSSEDEQAARLPSKLLHRRKMKTNVDEKAFRGWILSTRLLLCHINAEMKKKKKSKRNKECCEILNPHQNQIICSLACGWTVFILSVRKLEMKLCRRWKKKKKHSVFKSPKRQKCQKKKRSSEPNKKTKPNLIPYVTACL